MTGETGDPWGLTERALTAEPPELSGRLAVLAAVDGERELDPEADAELLDALDGGDARAEELPEVAALMGQGWRPLEPAPIHVGVSAAWPAAHRGWVPDRRPHCSVTASLGPRGRRLVAPYDPTRFFDDAAVMAGDCGLPPPPSGRLWLLHSPWASVGVQVLLARADAHGHQLLQDRDPAGGYRPHVALHTGVSELLSWTEAQFWAWWDDPDGPAPDQAWCARAWLARGRDGEQSAALVLAGLFPDDLDTLTAPTGRDGAGLTEDQAVAWTRTVGSAGGSGEVVGRVLAWRRLGLPPDPPPPSRVHLSQLDPERVAAWFDDGFALDDVARLHGIGLDRAHGWRSAGFPTDEVVALLGADPTLTPDEATAFTTAGVSNGERRVWVAAGFDAADAHAYTDLDVYPGEARVWRAHGRTPADARAHRERGGGPLPDDVGDLGWFAYGTTGDRAQRSYQVTDPPGTRGRTAHEQREREQRRERTQRS